MALPRIKQIGPHLPIDWHRPTAKLVRQSQQFLNEGLAPPSAPQLSRPAVAATEEELSVGTTAAGIELLEGYVRPGSASKLAAVGMAYPQLMGATHHSIRVLVAQADMASLLAAHRSERVITLVNPRWAPVRAAGQEVRAEKCFSMPGIGVRVRRWRGIVLYHPDGRSELLTGVTAWIVQHETDHLDGVLCTELAIKQGGPLYFVPPDWSQQFTGGGFWPGWPTIPPSQYAAIKSGEFDLAKYAKYL